MSRSSWMNRLGRALQIVRVSSRTGWSSQETIDRLREEATARRLGRREVLGGLSAAVGLAACGGVDDEGSGQASGQFALASADVGIVGAGLAGLACAYELSGYGMAATVHEASGRVGGRAFSLGGAFGGPVQFPGQVVERGGEFIDTAHTAMKGYAKKFGLDLIDVSKDPGEIFYYFDGVRYPEAAVVDEFRVLVDAMRDDLRTLGAPTATSFTPADEALDRMSLRQYLESRGAGPLIKQVLDVAYTIEYGLDIDQQSCLGFLMFIHADRRSKFTPFGVFSDERYHISGGNQRVSVELAARLPAPVAPGRQLVRARKTPAGRVELTFSEGNKTRSYTHDLVVFAIPFTALARVDLDPSLALPDWKLRAIRELRYGTNSKMMVGFSSRVWASHGSNGSSYSDLADHQSTWETDAFHATSSSAVLTDYSGGARGARLDPSRVQQEADAFLKALDKVYPGAYGAARRDAQNRTLVHLENWSKNPLTLGSYTANHPGYFTTIADNEARPVGNLFFAGEHTSSFYEWQGFMEGGVLSGQRAAAEILAALKK